MMQRTFPLFCLFVVGAMWGCTIPLTKIVVSTGHAPLGLIFWQFLGATLILTVITRIRKSTLIFDGRHIRFFLIIALTGTLLPNSTSYLAAFHLPGGVMALILAMIPMFSLMIALICRFESFNPLRFAGICLGAAAIALIILPDSSLPDPSKSVYVLVALIAPFLYAVEGNYLSVAQPSDTGPMATLLGASLIGTLLSLPVSIATGTFIDPRISGIGMPEIALLVVICLHVAAYTGYIWIVGQSGAVFGSQVAYIVTPAGVLLSIAMLGERPSPWIWLALTILLTGLFLVQPKARETAPTAC